MDGVSRLERGEGNGGLEGAVADGFANEGGHHGIGAEGASEVSAEATDIGTAVAGDSQSEVGIGDVDAVEGVDGDLACGDIDRESISGELVGTNAIEFDGGVGGWDLLDDTDERGAGVGPSVGGGYWRGVEGSDGGFDIGGVAGVSEEEGAEVGFGEGLEGFDESDGFTDGDDEDTFGDGVEGAGVTDFEGSDESLDFVDTIAASDSAGFAEVENTEHEEGRVIEGRNGSRGVCFRGLEVDGQPKKHGCWMEFRKVTSSLGGPWTGRTPAAY